MIPRFKPWLGWAEFRTMFRRNAGAVERFEQEFARTFGAAEAVAFPHGRSALWAFLNAVGVTGAEVVMPAYTCSVVAHAISLSGNHPRFVDISLDDYNMDLNMLPAAINERTRAVVATHLFGYPLDLDRMESIIASAEARYGNKIWLIQDCAHSFGASWKGRLVGSSGDVALYGLNISKMMTSIFGGMLTFSNAELAAKARSWRDAHFLQPSWRKGCQRRMYLLAVYIAFSKPVYAFTWWLQERTPLLNRLTRSYHLDEKIHFPPDFNERMLNLEAAVGLEQLKRYPQIVARRRAVAAYFDQHLSRRPGWVLPPLIDGATYSHYVVRVPQRAAAVAALAKHGIQLGELIQYSVPELTSYRDGSAHFAVSAEASTSTVNLPLAPTLTPSELDRIKGALNSP
ncbi:MAG: DegT/DnrJ/EryC1/StrS family aminotransferase [Acidovorax sp.]|nr:DegT/DnrJ/EryC1/StrS family aminotransferase [Acidovorax sp.]